MSTPYPAGPAVGNDAGLFYNSGTYLAPVWVLIDECGEVNLADWNVSEAEIVTRASDWAVALVAKFRAAIEFQYLWGANWTVLNWLRQAFMSRSALDILFMDMWTLTSTEPFAQGLNMPAYITQFPINQPNEEVIKVDTCRMVPAYAVTTPADGIRIHPTWVYSDGLGGIVGDEPTGTFAVAAPNDDPMDSLDGVPDNVAKLARGMASQRTMQDANAFNGMGHPPVGLYAQMLMDKRTKSYPIMAEVPARIARKSTHKPVQPLPDNYPVFIPAVEALKAGWTEIPLKTMDLLDRMKILPKETE